MNLNKKWWHRLIKVVFVLVILISVSITTYLVIDYYKPEVDKYESTYKISCLDFENVFGNIEGSNTFWGTSLRSPYSENAKYFCSEPGVYEEFYELTSDEDRLTLLAESETISNLVADDNYELILSDKVIKGSWLEMFGYLLVALLSYFIFFSLLRYIYFYIVKNEHKYLFNERNKKN